MQTLRPGKYQKFIHRFLMLPRVSGLLAAVVPRADSLVLWATRGAHTATEIAGLPVIQLTTSGARTGKPRTSLLISLFDEGRIVLIASNFGKRTNPGWYFNLKANPRCTVRYHGFSGEYQARPAAGAERERYWELALSFYLGYERYRERAAPFREIPVLVLEPG